MTIDQVIGSNVHELMWRQRVKQAAMLNALGVSRSTLTKKLRGDITWMAKDIEKAAEVLNVDPGRLFSVAGAGFEPATSGTRVAPVIQLRPAA